MKNYFPIYRTALSQSKGLGSSRSGVKGWALQRITAMALVPLGLWLLYVLVVVFPLPYPEVLAWVAHPVHMTFLLMAMMLMILHGYLGMKMIVEDYVHASLIKLLLLVVLHLFSLAAAVAVIIALVHCLKGA